MPPEREPTPPDPRPSEPTFPFAQARAAVTAIDELIDALRTFSNREGTAAADLFTGDFAGTFRQRFEQHHEQSAAEVKALWHGSASVLEQDRAALVQQIDLAEQRRDDWQVALDQWKTRQAAPADAAA